MNRQAPRSAALGLSMAAMLVFAACSSTATTAPRQRSQPAPSTAASAAPSTAVSPTAAVPSFAPPEKTSLNLGLSTSGETSQFAEQLAGQIGLYTKLGFSNVDRVRLPG